MPIPLTFLITDLHRGGSPLMLAALAAGLQDRGQFRPRVVSIAPLGEIAEVLQERGVQVVSLNASHNRDLRVVSRFAQEIREHTPKIVCSILVHANLLTIIARATSLAAGPRPVWIQSIHTVQERPRWHWWAQGLITGYADAFIAPSHAIVAKLQAYGPVPLPRVIPNGIDVARFANAQPMSRSRWPNDACLVGYVGRFDRVKRLDLLIRAMAKLIAPDDLDSETQRQQRHRTFLVLVGYGSEELRLRALVKRLHLAPHVHFPGPTLTPERWYKTFDLFCSPSAAEGFGLTLVEATAAGLPVIACGTPAVRETLPQALWISPDPTVAELTQVLAKSLVERSVQPLNLAALQARYSVDVMVQRYEEALLEALQTAQ